LKDPVPPKRVLCVDDDADTLELRKLLLESSGYAVATAPSGVVALELLGQDTEVDLVLLDYLMPGMNGDELAQHLRSRYPQLPLVAVSGVRELPAEFLGVLDASVQKGQDPEVLLATIANVLDNGDGKHVPR
jgi:CheY-like chemotaxis protein